MKNYQSVIVGQVRSLEVGDVIALKFLDGVISGKVTGVPFGRGDLTPEQIAYMQAHELEPYSEAPWGMIASPGERLIFGEFVGTGRYAQRDNHMFLHEDLSIAVFPQDD